MSDNFLLIKAICHLLCKHIQSNITCICLRKTYSPFTFNLYTAQSYNMLSSNFIPSQNILTHINGIFLKMLKRQRDRGASLHIH